MVIPDKVLPEIAEKILSLQRRCVVCGSTYNLHIHHRVFQSEKELGVQKHLEKMAPIYRKSYGKELIPWTLHSIQNLVVLCIECHEGKKVGVHGGNEKLRQFLRNSFTCPITGFNIPFRKKRSLF